MADYVIFIHGVNTRQERDQQGYSGELFNKITGKTTNNTKEVKKIELYWGDVNVANEQELVSDWQASTVWQQLWFRGYRENQLLQFIGDAALYISRAVGEKMLAQLFEQLKQGLEGANDNDELHLVAHSWGTVILFDILFASRWDENTNVENIRKAIYGVRTNASTSDSINEGYKVVSIHTIGSPIAIYQLMRLNNNTKNTHEISTRLKEFINTLYQTNGNAVNWNNYIHPGDPVGYPLEKVLPSVLGLEDGAKIKVSDIILPLSGFIDFAISIVNQSIFSLLLNGGKAHGSYWKDDKVAAEIAGFINQ
jgi:hypothetical protein